MKRTGLASIFVSLALVVSCASVFAESEGTKSKSQWKREKIDLMEKSTMDQLFVKDKHAKSLYDMSYGYAVFSSVKVMFGVSGGGGSGVAVTRNSGQRVYMKMGTGGLGLGLGGQKSQIVFLFQDRHTMEDFINNGWQGDASANAVAGTAGANAATSFTKGMVIYQFTESGLMLKADAAGTKYWVDKRLNKTTANQTASGGTAPASGVVNISSEPIEPKQ
jgi:lipid-binding SYLF domain-containing protein